MQTEKVTQLGFGVNEPIIGIFGEMLTGKKLDDITIAFKMPFYNTDFDMKPAEVTGDGSVVVEDQLLKVSSASSGTAKASSKKFIRYRAGHTGTASFTARFEGNGDSYIGASDDDGFRIGVDGGIPYVSYVKNGVETRVSKDSWKGQIDADDIDWTKINIFGVIFGYLGVANPIFLIRRNGWKVLHIIETEGKLETTHIGDPSFPITAYAENGSRIETASWNGGTIDGSMLLGGRPFQAKLETTLSGTNLATLGTFHNKTTYKGVANKVTAQAVRYKFHIDIPASGYGDVEFRIIKNATLAGAPSYSDVSADNSIIEADQAQTYSADGREILVEWVPYSSGAGAGGAKAGGEVSESAYDFDLYLLPNETATITAQNVGLGTENVKVRTTFNWIEHWA